MPNESLSPVTFVVPGQSSARDVAVARGGPSDVMSELPGGLRRGRTRQSVQVRAARGSGPNVRVEAVPGRDVVVIQIAGGPELVLHPETARDLLLAQRGSTRRRGARDTATGDEVAVPLRLQWSGLDDGTAARGTRGSFGDVLVSAFHVVSDVLKGPAAKLTASEIAKISDSQVTERVYALDARALSPLKDRGTPLDQLPATSTDGPALVFLHGTFSSTHGAFATLWTNHPDHVATLFRFYGNRVFALDHATLGVSPIENALTLVRALRPNTRLHLVSHSRGGLVAEVLAKVCANPALTAADHACFKGKQYRAQLDALKELASLVAERRIAVERVVRVACPSRGTLLASRRLDAYVSVLKWGLELASVPVAPALVDFLGAVAQRRTDPTVLPGLAAQIPGSPLIRWLHAGGADVPGDLRVIAGDLAGDSVSSWIKTLLSDAFYWTDNDLVVQTRGMYGGSPRVNGATFLLDQGATVTHFNYFANERSADAVVGALTESAPPGFRDIGPLSWAGQSAVGSRGSPNVVMSAATGARPAVILVPDILSSHLRIGDERVWLSRRSSNELGRLDYTGAESGRVEPDGLIDAAYRDLANFLSRTHDVIDFAYDWRQPIEETAKLLAELADGALTARGRHSKATAPVRFVAHGMGGLVVRALEIVAAPVWDRILEHDDARIVMVGVPNGGSWAPMQVLSGDETFGGVLEGLGNPLQEQETRQILATFPGFIQLQAGLTDPTLALGKLSTWETLAAQDLARVRERSAWHNAPEQVAAYGWGIPAARVLERAVRFRTQLDAREESFVRHAGKVVAVVGAARSTPAGFENGDDGFVFRNVVDAGDGYITTENAVLADVPAWSVAAEHRSLTTTHEAFPAYEDLLKNGTTRALPSAAPAASRGAAKRTYEQSRPSRRPTAPPPAQLHDLLSVAVRDASLGSGIAGPALAVTVINGNLEFIRQPLMLGHYRSLVLTGTEWVMDKLIGGTMSQLVGLRQYPDAPTSHKIFINRAVNRANPLQMPRPEAVIVVGLGEEGKLSTTDLTATVTQGVIGWAQRLVEETASAPAQFELAATLIGSGGAGISAGQSAQAVAQGVRDANLRLIDAGWPSIGHLYLVELYLDRASEAWRALEVQATSSGGQYRITETVRQGTGALRRPLDSNYRGTDYDLVSATTQRDAHGSASIAYRLDTKRARSEVRATAMQGSLLKELVLSASNEQNSDAQIGRTLFQLLIPPEMEPFMGGTASMVLEVDSGSAGIPWELLDSPAGARGGADARPWAIRSKLLRKLRTDDFRSQVDDADAEAHVLVIGEPQCDPTRYPRLPAAREEARAVAQSFIAPSPLREGTGRVLAPDRVKALIADDGGGADARTVINAVLEREWRIVHIAGHGEPPEKVNAASLSSGDAPQMDGDPRGVVLSNSTFLGPREIEKMRVVPELVFVNCCHLAARNIGQLLAPDHDARFDRAAFAAGVAESLIKVGVRCVIAAGWAVDDEPAKTFATTFYDQLLNGRRFLDAVAEARLAAYALGGNTWAAYQCYGDPDWRFRWETGDAQRPEQVVIEAPGSAAHASGMDGKRPPSNVAAEFSAVASLPDLLLALETLTTRSHYDDVDQSDQRRKIGYLQDQFAARWGDNGSVAEAFADAWAEADDRRSAILWYRRAVNAPDGSASMRATEQLANLRARVALEMVDKVAHRLERLRARKPPAKAREIAAARATLDQVVKKARAETDAARALLEPIATQRPSVERLSLCGSAWKRRAMIERIAADSAAEDAATTNMKTWYERAETLARQRRDSSLYYPALNRMAAELVVDAREPAWTGFASEALTAVRDDLETKTRDDPDFWSVAGRTELRLYDAIGRSSLAAECRAIRAEYDDLWARVRAFGDWDSVDVQLRFVLPKYIERATGAERDAAIDLMNHVRRLVARAKHATTPA